MCGGVVGIEIADALGDGLRRQLLEDFLADRVVDLGERREVELAAHQLDEARPQLGIERLDQVAGVGLVQLAGERLQRRGVAALDRRSRPVRGIRRGSRRPRRGTQRRARRGHVFLVEHAEPCGRDAMNGIGALVRPAFCSWQSSTTPFGSASALAQSRGLRFQLRAAMTSDHDPACICPLRIGLLALGAAASALRPRAPTAPAIRRARHRARAGGRSRPSTPRVGRKHFPATLPLAPKEVVLTFDDGPWPGTTDRGAGGAQARMRAGDLLPARPQRRRASGAGAPGAGRGPHRRAPHLFASAAEPYEPDRRRGRDRPRLRRGRRRALWQGRRGADDAVLPLSGLCLQPGAARPPASGAASRCSAPTSGRATGIR